MEVIQLLQRSTIKLKTQYLTVSKANHNIVTSDIIIA
jgi:hypothetical protein